jgi:AAA15 family ATPase/GTPase
VIIKLLKISGYKNLVNCVLRPQGLHAITGCNGSGKTNLLEVVPFVVGLNSSSDEYRERIMRHGTCPNGRWFPESSSKDDIRPLEFSMDAIIDLKGKEYLVRYSLSFTIEITDDSNSFSVTNAEIAKESLHGRELGKPGRLKSLLSRSGNSVTVPGGKSQRGKITFKCKTNMSALHALEVREASDFPINYPVINLFRNSLLSSRLVRLDPELFSTQLSDPDRNQINSFHPGTLIETFDPYIVLKEIESDEHKWTKFTKLLNDITGLERIMLYESTIEVSGTKLKHIFPEQHDRLLDAAELSTGNVVIIAYLLTLFRLLSRDGIALFEEPENHLHPKAVVDLIEVFKDFSDGFTLILSTHSPVLLNSLKASQVTVMKHIKNGFVTTENVQDIKEAVEALERGYLSFGDLLQNNFRVN